MKITKKEFIELYAKNSQLTVEQVLKYMEVIPCHCGEGNCKGWQMKIIKEEYMEPIPCN